MHRLSVLFVFLLACGGVLPGRSGPAGGGGGGGGGGGALTRMVVDGDKFPDARCNDGTTPVLYLRRADAENTNRWVLWFKGGASCADERGCASRSAELTSARPWMQPELERLGVEGGGDAEEGGAGGILSSDPAQNPDFHGWNIAYLVYCTSDDWAGASRASENPLGLHFTGQQVVDAMVAALSDPAISGAGPKLSDATDVLVTGSSAGAKGVLVNVDRLAAGALRGAKVRAIVDAGAISRETDPGLVSAELQKRWATWGARADADCVAAHPEAPWDCLEAQTLVAGRHLQTDTFWHLDQLDPKLGTETARTGPVDRDANAERARAFIESVDHGFSPRFQKHMILNTARFAQGRVDGASMADVVARWYFDRPGSTRVVDTGTEAGGPAERARDDRGRGERGDGERGKGERGKGGRGR